MKRTLNQVNELLEGIATAHQQINSYGIGDLWEIVANGAVTYPLMFTVINQSSLNGKILNLNISLLFMDLVHKDESNELDVSSDMLQVGTDVIAQLRSPLYEDWFLVGDSVSLDDFTERFNDEVTGWKVDLSLQISEQFNLCALPIVDAPEGPSGCSPALVQNSDLSYLVYVASGSTLTLPDTTINFNVGGNITSTTIPTLKDTIINVVWQ
jgi:hypothetical protein